MLEHLLTGKALDRERERERRRFLRPRTRERAPKSKSELEKIFGGREGTTGDGKADAKISIVRQGGKEEQNSSCKFMLPSLHTE